MNTCKFQIRSDHSFYSERLRGVFIDEDYLSIVDGLITVKASDNKPFNWDGCSPKTRVLGWFLIGTPDFKGTYSASMFHDNLYEYKIDKVISDLIFLDLMTEGKFLLRYIYYKAVKRFGKQ